MAFPATVVVDVIPLRTVRYGCVPTFPDLLPLRLTVPGGGQICNPTFAPFWTAVYI